MEEIKEFDCFEDGCGKCEVCEYLNFRETAENCAPSGSTIERNEKIERYLKRKDEEIDLAVSKERERVTSKTDEVWDLLCQMDTNIKSEKEYAKDIINLINNK